MFLAHPVFAYPRVHGVEQFVDSGPYRAPRVLLADRWSAAAEFTFLNRQVRVGGKPMQRLGKQAGVEQAPGSGAFIAAFSGLHRVADGR